MSNQRSVFTLRLEPPGFFIPTFFNLYSPSHGQKLLSILTRWRHLSENDFLNLYRLERILILTIKL
jgi:hypothetical protein